MAGIAVEATETGHAARVRIGDCEAAAEYRPRQSVVLYRDPCRRPATEKLATLARLAEALLTEASDAPPRLAVFVGSIAETFPDLAADLVVAAGSGSNWDSELASRSSDYANGIVSRLLDRTEVGGAIRSFRTGGYRSAGILVDRVAVARPRQLPFPLPPHVVSANSDTPLPYDGLLWIVLGKA